MPEPNVSQTGHFGDISTLEFKRLPQSDKYFIDLKALNRIFLIH